MFGNAAVRISVRGARGVEVTEPCAGAAVRRLPLTPRFNAGLGRQDVPKPFQRGVGFTVIIRHYGYVSTSPDLTSHLGGGFAVVGKVVSIQSGAIVSIRRLPFWR